MNDLVGNLPHIARFRRLHNRQFPSTSRSWQDTAAPADSTADYDEALDVADLVHPRNNSRKLCRGSMRYGLAAKYSAAAGPAGGRVEESLIANVMRYDPSAVTSGERAGRKSGCDIGAAELTRRPG